MNSDVSEQFGYGDKIDFGGKVGAELYKEMYKRLKDDLQNEMKLMKGTLGKKGEELDKKKYLKLISEYNNFKEHNIRHLRLNSAANLTTFGKHTSYMLFHQQL